MYGLRSVPAPYHAQTGSRPGTPSGQSPDEAEQFEDRPSSAQSPTNIHHIITYVLDYTHTCSTHLTMYTLHSLCVYIHMYMYTHQHHMTCVPVVLSVGRQCSVWWVHSGFGRLDQRSKVDTCGPTVKLQPLCNVHITCT